MDASGYFQMRQLGSQESNVGARGRLGRSPSDFHTCVHNHWLDAPK